MLSDFCKKKYYHLFTTFLDQDKNGAINKDDVKIFTYKAKGITKYSEAIIEESWLKVFRSMVKALGKREEELTLEDWFQLMQQYAEDPDNCEWGKLIEETSFLYLLDDTKGGVTAASHATVFLRFDIPEDEAKSAFSLASPNKTVLNREEFRALVRQYITTDDKNAPGNFIFGKVKFL